jgi:ribosomal protein L37AE/L43A
MLRIFQVLFGCHHHQLSRVFTIKHRTYHVCLECGREFDHLRAANGLPTALPLPWLR